MGSLSDIFDGVFGSVEGIFEIIRTIITDVIDLSSEQN